MDIESLKELNGIVALHVWLSEKAKKDLTALIDEAIARQSVKSDSLTSAIDRIACWELENPIMGEDATIDLEEIPVAEARIILTALQAYQPWIPVSNIKPEKSGRYIAYVPEHWTADSHKDGKVIIAYFRELNYEGKRRAWDDGAWGISGEVTHYMPLPEPPKGE